MKEDNFEKSIKRLEEIVELLEENSVPLDEAIKLFEEGIKLSRQCAEKLNNVEKKIKLILGKDNDEIILEDF